jgi:hypothetical protein
VRVDAHPWARVFVDGKPAGTTPLGKPLELTEGTHTLRFEHAWYEPVERTVDVIAGSIGAPVIIDFEAMKVPLKKGKTRPPPEAVDGATGSEVDP